MIHLVIAAVADTGDICEQLWEKDIHSSKRKPSVGASGETVQGLRGGKGAVTACGREAAGVGLQRWQWRADPPSSLYPPPSSLSGGPAQKERSLCSFSEHRQEVTQESWPHWGLSKLLPDSVNQGDRAPAASFVTL